MYNINEILKKDYIDVYEQMYLEDRCEFLFAVWRDIIIPNSNYTLSQLNVEKYNIIKSLYNDFKICVNDNSTLVTIDKNVVMYLLKLSIKLNKISLIDFIFKRTKSAASVMPQYFYPEEILDSYIMLLNIDKAKEVLNYVYSLDHRSYLYRIIEIKLNKYKDYPDFYKELLNVQCKSIVQLLKNGENLNLNLNLDMLLKINQYI